MFSRLLRHFHATRRAIAAFCACFVIAAVAGCIPPESVNVHRHIEREELIRIEKTALEAQWETMRLKTRVDFLEQRQCRCPYHRGTGSPIGSGPTSSIGKASGSIVAPK